LQLITSVAESSKITIDKNTFDTVNGTTLAIASVTGAGSQLTVNECNLTNFEATGNIKLIDSGTSAITMAMHTAQIANIKSGDTLYVANGYMTTATVSGCTLSNLEGNVMVFNGHEDSTEFNITNTSVSGITGLGTGAVTSIVGVNGKAIGATTLTLKNITNVRTLTLMKAKDAIQVDGLKTEQLSATIVNMLSAATISIANSNFNNYDEIVCVQSLTFADAGSTGSISMSDSQVGNMTCSPATATIKLLEGQDVSVSGSEIKNITGAVGVIAAASQAQTVVLQKSQISNIAKVSKLISGGADSLHMSEVTISDLSISSAASIIELQSHNNTITSSTFKSISGDVDYHLFGLSLPAQSSEISSSTTTMSGLVFETITGNGASTAVKMIVLSHASSASQTHAHNVDIQNCSTTATGAVISYSDSDAASVNLPLSLVVKDSVVPHAML